ncbi:unnamed protein product, partial [Didymodactylos carnosus]
HRIDEKLKEMVKLINNDTYLSCLHELNMCMWQVIKSYQLLYLWHKNNTQTQFVNENLEPNQMFIIQKLETGSIRLWNEIQQKIKIFIIEADITNFQFDIFIHILKIINRLIEIGEQFCHSDSIILKEALRKQSVNYFCSYHSARLDELKLFLENESWEWCPVKTTFHITQLHEFHFLRDSSSITSDLNTSISFNQKQEINLFDYYLYNDKENPFDIEQKHQLNRDDDNDTDSIEDVLDDESQLYREHQINSSTNDFYDNDDYEDENEKRSDQYHSLNISPTQDNYRRSRSKYHDKNGPAIVTNTTLNVTRLFGRYMQMIDVLKPIAFDVIICITQLFDYYLYTIYSLFACDMNEIPLDALSTKLRFTIKRISDNLIQMSDQAPLEAKDKIARANLSPLVDINSLNSVLYGLPQRVVAAESLVFLAQQFDFLLPYLNQLIPNDKRSFLTQFYSQTVQVTHELRIPIYHNVSANVIDYMSIAIMISKVNWDIHDIMTQHNVYVDVLIKELQTFRTKFDDINEQLVPIPKAVYITIWDQILDKSFYTLVEGYANIKRCSNEGRALMQLDFQQLLRKLEQIVVDLKPLPHREFVENYIKAYYLPEQSVEQWIHNNTMYTPKQRTTLVSMMTHLSRRTRTRLIQLLDERERSRTPVTKS